MKTPYGTLLRSARRQQRMTLEDVAKLLGVSISYVSDIEHGHRRPLDPVRNERLAFVLKVDPRDLEAAAAATRGSVEFKSSDPQRIELAAALARQLEHFTPDEVERLREYLDEQQASKKGDA